MNKLLLLFFISLNTFSQTIDIVETTIKVPILSEEVFYHGLAEGDQLILNFEELKGKELKEFEITELPSSSKFMEYKAKKMENKIINITRTGIYKFRLYNSSLGVRICKIKIQRIPASEKTKNFNTCVYWRTLKDTTYTPTEENYLEKTEQTATEIYSANPQLSSQNALNNNDPYQVVDFVLPQNTTSWSFYIGTGSEGKAEYERAKKVFLKSATTIAETAYGPLGSLAMGGASYFINVQGEDNVKYWFINNPNDVTLFRSGQSFRAFKQGDVITEASQMILPLTGKIYLALYNDNTFEPIQLTIKVVAIQSFDVWKTRTVQVMSISERQEPYLKN